MFNRTHRLLQPIILSVFLVTVNGCSFGNFLHETLETSKAEYLLQHPLPLPTFISAISPHPGAAGTFHRETPLMYFDELFANAICFEFNNGAEVLWSGSTQAQLPSKLWLDNLQLKLDGVIIPPENEQMGWDSGPSVFQTDKQGNIIRQYAASSSICYKTQLTKRLHLASITLKVRESQQFYMWAFRVDNIQ